MSEAIDFADQIGFDITELIKERNLLIQRLTVNLQHFSRFHLLQEWVHRCATWREEYSQHYRKPHEYNNITTGILSELSCGLLLFPQSLNEWLPTTATSIQSDNTYHDFCLEWTKLKYDIEVRCVQPYHQYVPANITMGYIDCALISMIQHDNYLYELDGLALPQAILDHGEHDPIQHINFGFPREKLYRTKQLTQRET